MKLLLAVAILYVGAVEAQQAREVFLGEIPTRSHGVSGQVYAIGDRTIAVRNLNYDGQAPDAYFWIGSNEKPDVLGIIVPDEKGSTKPLKGYRNANVVLQLPAGKTLRNIKYFGLWCRAFQENFGHIPINVS